MKLTFNQTANGTYELEFKVSTDFNLHVERTDASQDLYVYYRGSSEGEYKFYKKYYGKVVDEDINIVDNIVPKFFKVKSASNPVLCEVTGEVEVVIGGEDKPEGGSELWKDNAYLDFELYHEAIPGDKFIIDLRNRKVISGGDVFDIEKVFVISEDGSKIRIKTTGIGAQFSVNIRNPKIYSYTNLKLYSKNDEAGDWMYELQKDNRADLIPIPVSVRADSDRMDDALNHDYGYDGLRITFSDNNDQILIGSMV